MISIIVPIYKVEKYIADTIHSIVNQSYQEFELILVDDGTPDRSASIAEEILQRSTVYYTIIRTENRGVSAARNTGLENAQGGYVIMVDSDDIISPGFLEDYVKLIATYPDSDILSTSFSVVDEKNGKIFTKREDHLIVKSAKEAQLAFSTRSLMFLLPTMMFRRSFIEENHIRFDEGVRYSEDVQYIWKTLAYNQQVIAHNTQSNYNYILHSGSTMTASGYQKILTGYQGIICLYQEIKHLLAPEIKEIFVSIWIFAMLHSSAKLLKYRGYKNLMKETEAIQSLRITCVKGVNAKLRIIAFVHLVSCRIGYIIFKKF